MNRAATIMPEPILTREQVATHLRVSLEQLARYEARGLIHPVQNGELVGYERREIRRIWSVVSLHRDAGINLAGIEAILRMREQFTELHDQLRDLTERLRHMIETESDDAQE